MDLRPALPVPFLPVLLCWALVLFSSCQSAPEGSAGAPVIQSADGGQSAVPDTRDLFQDDTGLHQSLGRLLPPGRWVMIPDVPVRFWQGIMTPETIKSYLPKNGVTFCNVFLKDNMDAHWGPGVSNAVFPEGLKRPNELYYDWQKNTALFWLPPETYTTEDIQTLVDGGCLVLMSYHYDKGPGHVAFLAPRDLTLSTVPPIGQLEGKNGRDLEAGWLPLVAQAGTYTGVSSVAYGSNGWFKSKQNLHQLGIVRFYLVRQP